MKPHLCALALLALAGPAAAQQTVTGRVVAHGTGTPLPQTSVRLDGDQAQGTSTDEAGRFSLAVKGLGSKLIFSHLGYQTLTLPAAQLSSDVQLDEQSYQIGEVVVSYASLQKLLVKKWKIEEGSLDAAAQRLLLALQKRDPEKAEKLAKNPDAVRSVLKLARYDFQADGTVKAKVLLFGAKHQWRLDEEQRRLTVLDPEGHEATIVIVELTADRMVLRRPEAELPDVAYVPAG